jgi:hypothetical protein
MKRRFLKKGMAFTAMTLLLLLASVGFFFRSLSAERYAQAAADTIATGKTQLFQKSVSGALNSHQTFLAASTGSGYAAATDAEKIKIRVYLAFTRVLDVVLRNDGGTVDTLTELLAPYGIVRTGDAFDGMKFQLPLNDDRKIILPAGAPSSAEALRIFFSGPFLMAVNASIADMDAAIALCPATEGIDREIISRTLIDAGDPTQPDVEMDAGDYYLFRALLRFLKVFSLMSAGYNADLDIRDVVALANLEMGPEMIKRLLDRYPDFLKIRDASRLNEARLTLLGAIDDYGIASEKMRNDSTVQSGAEELFSLEPDNHEEALLRENLAKIKISLQGNTTADLVTERIGTEYSVYGGTSFTTTEPSFWEKGYHPEQHGYTYLGKASNTATFSGSYNCYIITTKPGNMAPVDTVQGSDGAYLGTNTTGSTNQWWNVGGAPDGAYALIGSNSGGDYYGFIVIRPSTPIASLTVHLTNVANIAREEHLQLNLFPLFGDGTTAPKALRELMPELNAYGYPLPGTMGHGLGDDPTLGGILPDFSTQDQWLKEMDGVFMPTGLLTISQVTDGAITIDGSVGDWTASGIVPVLTDVTGERGQGMAANGDLQKLFLALDSQYLYVRMDLAGAWNLSGQNFMYGLRFRQSPGDGPDKPGDVKIFARNRNGAWEVKAQSVQAGGWYGAPGTPSNPANPTATASAAAAGAVVEWRVPRGSAAGRFLAADTDAWFYDSINPNGWEYWYAYDRNSTCLQIQPSANVTGTLTVPGYDGVGPVRIAVYEYGPDLNFNTDSKKRIGSLGIYPDGSGNLPATYTVANLPVGSRVFVTVFWDRDNNGVISPGDYTNFYQPFTTAAAGTVLNITAGDDHAGYPPPRFYTAVVYHEKRPPPPTGDGNWNVVIAAQLTGPSPEDVSVTVTGPGGQYTLTPGAVISKRGLVYRTSVYSLPNGDYTFTAVDSLGRKAEAAYHYEERYDLPAIASLSPANGSYAGTPTPTLSWTKPAEGYAYQVWILDYNNSGNGVIWYVSAITTDTSVIVPAGVLLPDTPYRWFVRLYDRASNPMNYTMSPVYSFYTGAYAAAPAFSSVQMGTRPPTGLNPRYSSWVDAKVPGLAPWDATGWRLKKGATVVAQGTTTPNVDVRADDSMFSPGFQTDARPSDGNDYSFEMDVNRSGSMIAKTGISFAYKAVQAVDLTSLSPSNNHYFKTLTPTFSWSPVSDPDTYYRLRIFDPLWGRFTLWRSAWSKELSAIVPAGVLKAGGNYYWTVQTTAAINPSYVNAFVNTEGNSGNRTLHRFTLQLPRGDISGNGEVTLEDAIIALRVLAGFTPAVTLPGEVNADNRIGLPEAIYILQEVSGLR